MRKGSLSVLVSIALAVPVGAAVADGAPPPAPQVTDPCGDASTRVTAQDQRHELEPSAPARDLRTARIGVRHDAAGAPTALVATVGVCGTAGADHAYAVLTGFGDGCSMSLQYAPRRLSERATAPGVRLREDCVEQDTTPVASQVVSTRTRTVSSLDLPASAATFSGSTVTLTVPYSAVPAASRPRFADGAVWTGTGAVAADTDLGFLALSTPGLQVVSRWDYGSGSGYVVGQDARRGAGAASST